MTNTQTYNHSKPFTGTQNETFLDWLKRMEETYKLHHDKKKDIKIRLIRRNLAGEAKQFLIPLHIDPETEYELVTAQLRLKYDKTFTKVITECRLVMCRMKEDENVSEFTPRSKGIAETDLQNKAIEAKKKKTINQETNALNDNINRTQTARTKGKRPQHRRKYEYIKYDTHGNRRPRRKYSNDFYRYNNE
jgi:hypothetical protein